LDEALDDTLEQCDDILKKGDTDWPDSLKCFDDRLSTQDDSNTGQQSDDKIDDDKNLDDVLELLDEVILPDVEIDHLKLLLDDINKK
jgi:hypothetical protein